MDRFIAAAGGTTNAHFKTLKSNMDRFIVYVTKERRCL